MAHIIETIMGIRRGRFAELCSSKLTDVVKAVAQLNKPGSITIQLKLKPNTEGQVRLSGTVKVSSPHPDVGEAIFYVTEDGELERSDPKQTDIEDQIRKTMKGA